MIELKGDLKEHGVHSIRLTQTEINKIIQSFESAFPVGDKLWIFGSRVDPYARGGDIDLFIESQITDPDQIRERQADFHYLLMTGLGEQKIDIVIQFGDYELPIYDVARKEGVRLV